MANPFREELKRRQSANPFRDELERRQNEAMGAANAPARAEMPSGPAGQSQAFVRQPGDPQPTTGGQQPQSILGSFMQGPQRTAADVGVPGDPETTERVLRAGRNATGGLLGAAVTPPAGKIGIALLRSQFLGPLAGAGAGAEIARHVEGVDPMLGGVAGALLGRGRGR